MIMFLLAGLACLALLGFELTRARTVVDPQHELNEVDGNNRSAEL